MKVFNFVLRPDAKPRSQTQYLECFGYDFVEGKRTFTVIESRNIHDEIQRHKDACDYTVFKNFLLAQGLNGRLNFGECGEVDSRYQDILDAQALFDDLNDCYNKLPDVIKQKYKNLYEVLNSTDGDIEKLFNSASNYNNDVKNSNVDSQETQKGATSDEK